MKKGLILAVLTALLIGCGGSIKYLPIIDASIEGATGITQAGKTLAINDKNVAACYVTCALLTALGTTKGAVDGWMKGENPPGVIPAVDVDLAECVDLSGEPLKPIIKGEAQVLVTALIGGILPAIDAIIRAVLGSSDVSCEDKAVADGVLRYVQNVAPAVVNELVAPDGKLSVPEIVFNKCE
jgi:hypothetical protein